VRQSQTTLIVRTRRPGDAGRATGVLAVDNAFRRPGPVFLTITSGARGAVIYINGAPANTFPGFRLDAENFTGRLVLGNSPRQGDPWSGELLGFAIYHWELQAAEVLDHYRSWAQAKRPDSAVGNAAVYLLDERRGNIVHDKSGSGADLFIPDKYMVLDQAFLEPTWEEYNRHDGFWSAVVKNIVGFIPFGACFCAYFSVVRHLSRPALFTVALGAIVSLIIEVLQAYLPTRESGMTDLITNTFGTSLGVLFYRVFRFLVTTRPSLAFVARPRR
jgi:VanZ family protein